MEGGTGSPEFLVHGFLAFSRAVGMGIDWIGRAFVDLSGQGIIPSFSSSAG